MTKIKKTSSINNWGILSLFSSYLKRNRAIIVSIFVLPLIFIFAVTINYGRIINQNNSNPAFILMLVWLVQSASFAVQTFLTILLDFKQTIIYRRIGLTRITPLNFIIISSVFNMILMIISNLFIFVIVISLALAFKQNALLTALFHWPFLLVILFTLACMVLLTSVAILMAVLIKTRTGQTIAALIVNFLIIIPLFILIFFINQIIGNGSQLVKSIGVAPLIGIYCGTFVAINLLSFILYYLAKKYFKWYD